MKTRKLLLPLVLLLWDYLPAAAQAHIGDSLGHMLVQQSPINQWHSGPQDSCFELISFPDDYDANPTKTYPVLFFFHGAGEAGPANGSQLSRQLNNALPQFISQGLKPSALAGDGNTYKFIVVCPQAIGGSTDINHLYYILPDILKKVRADTTRLYITGLSYGGYGTWSCLTDNGASPFQGFIHRFAAILPQSQVALDQSINTGTATGYNRVAHVKDAAADSLPVLIVCGDADDKWQYSKAYRDSINAHNPYIPAILIDRPGQGHTAAAWDSIYSPTFRPSEIGGKNGYEWLIQYTNKRGFLTGASSSPPNKPPVANAGPDQTVTLPVTVTLDGSASYDPDGSIVQYDWIQLSGAGGVAITNSSAAKASVYGLQPGVYVFKLTVTDNSGATAVSQVTVNVSAGNQGLVANAGGNDTISLPLAQVMLDGSLSSVTGGAITSYTWEQESGPQPADLGTPGSVSTLATGLIGGVYVFQLTVKDDNGNVASAEVTVLVLPDTRRYVDGIRLYPNPAHDVLNFWYQSDHNEKLAVTILDVKGATVLSAGYDKQNTAISSSLNVAGLGRGVYYFEMVDGAGKKTTRMFVKQ